MSEIVLLLLHSAGADQPELKVLREVKELQAALRRVASPRNSIRVEFQFLVRDFEFPDHLKNYKPVVVHFTGHGTNREEILLLGDDEKPRSVSHAVLKKTFELWGRSVRLLVLSACYSEAQAKALTGRSRRGVGARKAVVPHVVGMRDAIGVNAAREFAACFYAALLECDSIDVAYHKAVTILGLAPGRDPDVPALLSAPGYDPAAAHLFECEAPGDIEAEDLLPPPSLPIAGNHPVTATGASFLDRELQRQRIAELLDSEAARLIVVHGSPEVGRTTLALNALSEFVANAAAPPLAIFTPAADGLRGVVTACEEASPAMGKRIETAWARPDPTPRAKARRVMRELANGEWVVLLHGLETVMNEEARIADDELAALLEATVESGGRVRFIATAEAPPLVPATLAPYLRTVQVPPGLPMAAAMQLLRDLDPEGHLGLLYASQQLLADIAEELAGVPGVLQLVPALIELDGASLQDIAGGFYRYARTLELLERMYRRLDPEDRIVWWSVAVFTRPVPVTAAGDVASAFGVAAFELRLRRLGRLGLIRIDESRVSMPSTHRAHAVALMPDGGQLDRKRFEHAAAEYWSRQRVSRNEWTTLRDLDPHIREIEHRLRAGDIEQAADVLTEMDNHAVAYAWDPELFTAFRGEVDGKLRDPSRLLAHAYGQGQVASILGTPDDVERHFRVVLRLANEARDETSACDALYWIAEAQRRRGSLEDGITSSRAAIRKARSVGDSSYVSSCLTQLSLLYAYAGRVGRACTVARRAVRLAGDDLNTSAEAHNAASLAAYMVSRFEEVETEGRAALRLYAASGWSNGSAYVLNLLGLTSLRRGDVVAATTRLEDASVRADATGESRLIGLCLANLGYAYLMGGDASSAGVRAQEARDALLAAGDAVAATAAGHLLRAAQARSLGDEEAERSSLRSSVTEARRIPDLFTSVEAAKIAPGAS